MYSKFRDSVMPFYMPLGYVAFTFVPFYRLLKESSCIPYCTQLPCLTSAY